MVWYIVGGAVIFIIVGVAVAKGGKGGSRFPYGSLAFEAELSLPPLMSTLAGYQAERKTADPDRAAELDKQIEFLSKQADEIRAIIDRGARSPGRGFVGFDPYGSAESSWTKAALNR